MSQDSNRLPPQTKYIVGNEACERFSFYGVMAILSPFLINVMHYKQTAADQIIHNWKSVVYLMPLLGAWIADRFWGRYHTILWISLAYCGGHALLAFSDGRPWALFGALGLLAIGTGGIKPSVAAFVGDQFVGGKERLLPKMYGLFYFSVNFGSFFAYGYIPGIKDQYGFGQAFALPGIAMGIATLFFWLGNKHYVKRPPSRLEDAKAVRSDAEKRADRVTVWRIVSIFAPIMVFWMLFDQQDTSWLHQGNLLREWNLGFAKVTGENMRAANPIIVMALIPLFQMVIYPLCERLGLRPTPLRRMGVGLVLAAASFVISSVLQTYAEAAAAAGPANKLSIGWQIPQFIVLTAGEVLVSTTGLEFAFSQAPKRLKSTILSLWYLSVSLGNQLTAQIKKINDVWLHLNLSRELLFYAGLTLGATGIFVLIARKFPEKPVVADPVDATIPPDPGKATPGGG